MISRQRLSTVLFFLSGILLLYPALFKINYSIYIVAMSWMLLSVSRSLLLFPSVKIGRVELKIGKEFK